MATPGHYFDPDPPTPSRPAAVRLSLPGWSATLHVDAGVFAARSVDAGTIELLKATSPPPAGDLLDLGCGYGPIACTLAHRAPGATVWAVDVNSRARDLTARNAAALGLTNVKVASPDAVPRHVRLAGIWSNPPIRIGKTALHDVLYGWIPRLGPDGVAWLVVQKHLGADSLQEWMRQQGWEAERVGSRKGYRLLRVRLEA